MSSFICLFVFVAVRTLRRGPYLPVKCEELDPVWLTACDYFCVPLSPPLSSGRPLYREEKETRLKGDVKPKPSVLLLCSKCPGIIYMSMRQ